MLAHDKATRTSIVRRGLKIRTDVLCQIVPAPPPDVDLSSLDKTATGVSQRERLEQHRTVRRRAPPATPSWIRSASSSKASTPWAAPARWTRWACRSCSRARCRGRSDADGPVANPTELGQKLAQSEQVRGCYVTNNFRFFYGREVEQADACSMARLLVDFKGADYNLTELLVALTRTDAFLYRGVTP